MEEPGTGMVEKSAASDVGEDEICEYLIFCAFEVIRFWGVMMYVLGHHL